MSPQQYQNLMRAQGGPPPQAMPPRQAGPPSPLVGRTVGFPSPQRVPMASPPPLMQFYSPQNQNLMQFSPGNTPPPQLPPGYVTPPAGRNRPRLGDEEFRARMGIPLRSNAPNNQFPACFNWPTPPGHTVGFPDHVRRQNFYSPHHRFPRLNQPADLMQFTPPAPGARPLTPMSGPGLSNVSPPGLYYNSPIASDYNPNLSAASGPGIMEGSPMQFADDSFSTLNPMDLSNLSGPGIMEGSPMQFHYSSFNSSNNPNLSVLSGPGIMEQSPGQMYNSPASSVHSNREQLVEEFCANRCGPPVIWTFHLKLIL